MKPHTFLVLIVIIIIGITLYHNDVQENWEIYKQLSYGHIKTGSEPMNYYVHKRYREPYRFPFQFVKTVPFKHLSYLD